MARIDELLKYIAAPLFAGVTVNILTHRFGTGLIAAVLLILCFHLADTYALRK